MEELLLKMLTVSAFVCLGAGVVLGEEKVKDKIRRSESIFFRWIIYSILDYGLMFLSIALVGVMRWIGEGFWITSFAMWLLDFVVALGLLMLCLKTEKDLTLGREYRRSVVVVFNRSRLVGIFSLLVFFIKAVVWDGPERIVEYYYQELNSLFKKIFTVVFLSFFQAIFWTYVYSLGFDGALNFLRSYF